MQVMGRHLGLARLALLLALVLVLVGGAAAVVRTSTSAGSPDQMVGLRRAAALDPCPATLGTGLPDLRLPCLGGGPAVRLRNGAPPTATLVNIWATWCPPCVREVPLLLSFARSARGQVAVVGVLHEDEPAAALTFAAQYGMHYPSLVDAEGQVLRRFGSGPPITLLLDARGQVRFVQRGEFHSVEQIRQLVRTHLQSTT